MAKFTNDKKLEALKAWLDENGIGYIENYYSMFGVTIDLKIPSLMIAIFLSDGDKIEESKKYFARGRKGMRLCFKYKPFFIRPSETKAFVLEKIRNCCYDRMVWLQRKFEKEHKTKEKDESMENDTGA
jgi:hypothetical protein